MYATKTRLAIVKRDSLSYISYDKLNVQIANRFNGVPYTHTLRHFTGDEILFDDAETAVNEMSTKIEQCRSSLGPMWTPKYTLGPGGILHNRL